MKQWLLLLSLGLMGGCVSFLPDYSDRDAGYRLILHQPIVIPPQRTRIFIQGGRIVGTGFDSYEVSCNIEVRKLKDEPQRIEPDTFVVNLVQDFFEEVAAIGWKAQTVAGLGLAGADVDGSPSMIYRGYHFWLHSPTQPDVIRLTCRGVFADPWEAYPPTYEEIEATLGRVASLKPVTETIQPGRF
ncbi:MAG: hypothetical protein DSZ00_03040 [Gammaproteobacteria bacterium]|nr:MAG: hypothetical protein DSZ02_07325 [Gammaproteobacteria bacterium]RTZ75000.1 MAG: hypothetical protein DSZ00_03040 [Gammaproteobacteria bacterium]